MWSQRTNAAWFAHSASRIEPCRQSRRPSRVASPRDDMASIFESGAVYYPTILLVPIVAGIALARWRPGHERLILLAVVLAFVVFDFALDDTRMDDIAFFVVLCAFMFGLGMLARAIARRVLRPRTT